MASWGEGILKDAQGIKIDADNVYCIERNAHCVHKCNRNGKLVMTLGRPGRPAAKDSDPFNRPTDLAIVSSGELFASDDYDNVRVHKFLPNGEPLISWGERGTGPDQFTVPHCVRVDKYDRVWVCDRNVHVQNFSPDSKLLISWPERGNRIQIFDTDGHFLTEWRGLLPPDTIHFDPNDDVVYIAELPHQVAIYTLDGKLIEVLADEEGNFTLLIIRPNKWACVIKHGVGWTEIGKYLKEDKRL